MRASRRLYAVALGATGLVLAGSMIGAAAFVVGGSGSSSDDSSWSRGLGGASMGSGWAADRSGRAMMGQDWTGADSTESPRVTREQAASIATKWISTDLPDATLDGGFEGMMGGDWAAATPSGGRS